MTMDKSLSDSPRTGPQPQRADPRRAAGAAERGRSLEGRATAPRPAQGAGLQAGDEEEKEEEGRGRPRAPPPQHRPTPKKADAKKKGRSRRPTKRRWARSSRLALRGPCPLSTAKLRHARPPGIRPHGLEVELPDERVVRHVGLQGRRCRWPIQLAMARAVARPAQRARRRWPSLARAATTPASSICDITRPVPNELILPPLLDTLEAAGIPRDKIPILVATGLHRPNEGDELVEMVGREIADNYRIENHHGQELDEHTYLGDSPRGVPIWIDSRYVGPI